MPFYLWNLLDVKNWKLPIFLLLYIVILFVSKHIITTIYQILNKKSIIDDMDDFLYGTNKKSGANWGGLFTKILPVENEILAQLIKEKLKIEKKKLQSFEVLEETERLKKMLNELYTGNVITGGTLFETLFCVKKRLKGRLDF